MSVPMAEENSNSSDIDDTGVPFPTENGDNTDSDIQNSQDTDEVKINPAWQDVLDKLPSEFHPQVLPKLTEWDQNFAKVQSEFAPYKPLLEKNVPYEAIENSMQLARIMNADPRSVWDELGKRYGFNSTGQGQQQVEEEDDLEEEDNSDPNDLSKNPQFAQLQQAYTQIQAQLQQQLNAQEETRAQREVESEWQNLETKIGTKFNDDVRTEIIRRAVYIGDQRGDGNYSIEEGYTDYANMVNRIRNQRANNTAPSVLSGNGGQPVSKKNLGNMTADERQDYIASFAEKLANENR